MPDKKGFFGHIWDDLLSHGIWDGIQAFFKTEKGGEMAIKVIKDTLSRGEAGGEGLSLLLTRLSSNRSYQDLQNRFWEWIAGDGDEGGIRNRLSRLQCALEFHYRDVKDGIVAQLEIILLGEDGDPAGKTVGWPKGLRPEDVFFNTWKAILRVEEDHPGAIDHAITYFTMGRETRLERWWNAFCEWLETNPTWRTIKETARRLSWAYLATIAGLTVLAILFAGSTIHFALEGKPGRTFVFLGITSVLILCLYTIRYPLQEVWQIATDLVGGGGVSWAEQKKTMTRRIGYLAATALVLLLVPFGSHPALFFTALLGLVVAFMLGEEHKRWQTFGQVVVAICILLAAWPRVTNATLELIPNESETLVSGIVKEAVPAHRFNPETQEPQRKFSVDPVTGKVAETKNLGWEYDPNTGERLQKLTVADYREVRENDRFKTCRLIWVKSENDLGHNPSQRFSSGLPAEIVRYNNCRFDFRAMAPDGRVSSFGWDRCRSEVGGWLQEGSPPGSGAWQLSEDPVGSGRFSGWIAEHASEVTAMMNLYCTN